MSAVPCKVFYHSTVIAPIRIENEFGTPCIFIVTMGNAILVKPGLHTGVIFFFLLVAQEQISPVVSI